MRFWSERGAKTPKIGNCVPFPSSRAGHLLSTHPSASDMSRVADSVDADLSDVQQIEVTIDDQAVTVIVVDAKNDPRIIVDADRRWEMNVEDEWAYPCWEDRSMPRWLEGLVRDLGVRGIRTGAHGGEI